MSAHQRTTIPSSGITSSGRRRRRSWPNWADLAALRRGGLLRHPGAAASWRSCSPALLILLPAASGSGRAAQRGQPLPRSCCAACSISACSGWLPAGRNPPAAALHPVPGQPGLRHDNGAVHPAALLRPGQPAQRPLARRFPAACLAAAGPARLLHATAAAAPVRPDAGLAAGCPAGRDRAGLAPLGFLMGIPFPAGMRLADPAARPGRLNRWRAEPAPRSDIPWIWAVNGAGLGDRLHPGGAAGTDLRVQRGAAARGAVLRAALLTAWRASSSGCSLDARPGEGHKAHPAQVVAVSSPSTMTNFHRRLHPARRADRDDDAPTLAQLLHQRGGQVIRGGGDDDGIEGGMIRASRSSHPPA